MIGLLVFSAIVAWAAIVILLAIGIAKTFKSRLVRWLTGLTLFTLVLPLPISDEIIGGYQLAALCDQRARLRLEEAKIGGRTVRVTVEQSGIPVAGTAVPISYSRIILRDAVSGQDLGGFERFTASGGILAHKIGITDSYAPIWMTPYACSPGSKLDSVAKELGFVVTY